MDRIINKIKKNYKKSIWFSTLLIIILIIVFIPSVKSSVYLLGNVTDGNLNGLIIISTNNFYTTKYLDLFSENDYEENEEEDYVKKDNISSNKVHTIKLYYTNKSKSTIEMFKSEFFIEINEDINNQITELNIFENGTAIISKKISLCNHNNICEPCSGSKCNLMESALTCDDCKSGESDFVCDLRFDNKCDIDCEEKDKDCSSCKYNIEDNNNCLSYSEETACYDENGESCFNGKVCSSKINEKIGNVICCKEGYCVTPKQIINNTTATTTTTTDTENNIKENELINKEKDDFSVQKESLTFYYFLLVLFGIIVVLLSIYFLVKLNSSKNIVIEIQRLKHKYNYQEIRQHLLEQGFNSNEINLAIEQHYFYDKNTKIDVTKFNKFFIFIFWTIIISILSFTSFASLVNAQQINFAVISDTNIGDDSIKLAESTDSAVAQIIQYPKKIDFVIHLGYMIAGNNYITEDKAAEMWKEYDSKVTLPLQKTNIPLLKISGWQDINSHALMDYYREVIIEKNPNFDGSNAQDNADKSYAFIYKNNLFIILDLSQAALQFDKEWFKEIINKYYANTEHVFVLSSLPFRVLDEYNEYYCKNCEEVFTLLDSAANEYGSEKVTLITSGSNVYYKGNYKGYNIVSVGSLEEPHTLINTDKRQKKSFVVISTDEQKTIISGLIEPFQGRVFDENLFPLIQPQGYTKYKEFQTKISDIAKNTIEQQMSSSANPTCVIPDFLEGYDGYLSKRISLKEFNEKYPLYEPIIIEASLKFNVPYELIKAIIIEESSGNTFPGSPSKEHPEYKQYQYCNNDGNCICNSAVSFDKENGKRYGPYCGLMQVDIDNYCLAERDCDKQKFIEGNPKDQIFAGAGGLKSLINTYCKVNSEKIDKNNPQFYMHIFGCYGKGSAGYIEILDNVVKQTGKEINQITPIDIITRKPIDDKDSVTEAAAIIHALIKEIRLDQCRNGIISDALEQPIISSSVGINAPTSLGTIAIKNDLQTLYYLTPNFKLQLYDSFKDYEKLRLMTVKFVDDMNNCILLNKDKNGNIDNCFTTLLRNEFYKKQGLVSNEGECKEDEYEELIYDIIEKIKNCKFKETERCQLSLPSNYFYQSKLDKNIIEFKFTQNQEDNIFLTAVVNGNIYSNEVISGRLSVVENENNIVLNKMIKEITIKTEFDKNYDNKITFTYLYKDNTKKEFINRKNLFELFYSKDGQIAFLTDSLKQYDLPYSLPIAENIKSNKKSFKLCFISQKKLFAGNMFELKLRNIIYSFSLQFEDKDILHNSNQNK